MKKHIYRPGDQVEIVNLRWIKRVGYALHWADLMEEVEADPRTADMIKAIGWTGRDMPRYFMQAVAKLHVEMRGFGGNERSIHYYPSHGYVGCVSLVEGKRVAYTGTRFPATWGKYQDTPNGPGEYWDEPGGLNDSKAHIILKTCYGEIEACDVKLVKAAK